MQDIVEKRVVSTEVSPFQELSVDLFLMLFCFCILMGIGLPIAQERVKLKIVTRAGSETRAASDSTPPHALNLTNAYLKSSSRLVLLSLFQYSC
jgi:hypothetical protein